MENKQTSIDWLVEKLEESGIPLMKYELEMIEQAKEMEKEQIIDAYKGGVNLLAGDVESASECYYNKTYNK